jgi:3-hydroxybutyryl-CoA dehydrogenase
MDKFAILGTGTMGAGIVQLAAQSGYRVTACDTSVEALERAQVYVREGLERLAEKGAFSGEKANSHYDRIRWTTNPQDLAEAEAAIEAITERVEPKKEALATLDGILPTGSLLLTNTSSISITDLATATTRPENVCGMHFFTPPPVREAIEIPRGRLTSDQTVDRVKALVHSLGKLPVIVDGDTPGFVANRFLMPMLLEACHLLEQGTATKEDIDLLVKRGIGFPIAPFELGDLIGLDVALDVITYVHKTTGDPYYEPPRILEELVSEGRLGRKSGQGFYNYGPSALSQRS